MKTKSWLMGLLVALFAVAFTGPVFADCWTAVAYNWKTQTFMIGKGQTLANAQLDAQEKAGSPSGVVTWTHFKFIAVAINDSGSWSVVLEPSEEEAEEVVLDSCQKMGGTNCRVILNDGCKAGR